MIEYITPYYVCTCGGTVYCFPLRDGVFRWQHGINPEASIVLQHSYSSGSISTRLDWLAEIHERENGMPKPANWLDWRDSQCIVVLC